MPNNALNLERLHSDACLKSFVEHLRAEGLTKETIDLYCSDIRLFCRDVGKDLIEVEAADVYRVVTLWQAQHAKEATIQRRAASLRRFYDLLYLIGLISVRPTATLHVPKPWRRVSSPAAEDLEKVIAATGTTTSPFDVRDRTILLLLRDSGIRANAIARAEVANVDWELRRLMLRNDKYGKDHWVPLSHRSTAALQIYVDTTRPYFLRERELPYLFISHNGHLTRQRIWQIANRWTMKVLGVRYSPHAWRHSVLTEGAEANMDVFDLKNMAGHLDPTTTQEYLRHSTAKLREIFYRSHPRTGKGETK